MKIHQSHHVNESHYNPATQTLIVGFVNGALYSYHGVPPTTYDSFLQADSPGTYFNEKIRNSYKTVKLMDAPPKKRRR